MSPHANAPDDDCSVTEAFLWQEEFREWSRDLLERAKRMAHATEERVQTLLTAANEPPP
jgi:hypothetical protein